MAPRARSSLQPPDANRDGTDHERSEALRDARARTNAEPGSEADARPATRQYRASVLARWLLAIGSKQKSQAKSVASLDPRTSGIEGDLVSRRSRCSSSSTRTRSSSAWLTTPVGDKAAATSCWSGSALRARLHAIARLRSFGCGNRRGVRTPMHTIRPANRVAVWLVILRDHR